MLGLPRSFARTKLRPQKQQFFSFTPASASPKAGLKASQKQGEAGDAAYTPLNLNPHILVNV